MFHCLCGDNMSLHQGKESGQVNLGYVLGLKVVISRYHLSEAVAYSFSHFKHSSFIIETTIET